MNSQSSPCVPRPRQYAVSGGAVRGVPAARWFAASVESDGTVFKQ
ncbi:hypothetical protein C7S14_6497 [Burkholderia cepacia]|nr:hypothetical protein C7S14_6497 [Burkholderia cepacia]